MIIGKTNNLDTDYYLKINDTNIERVTFFSYLGIIIDLKLKFHDYVHLVVKTLARKLRVLYRASSKLTCEAKKNMYNTMIRPHFTYCSTNLFLCNKTDIDKLQVQQNKTMRLILKCNRETLISDMLHKLNWLSVSQLIYLCLSITCKKNMLPQYLCENIRYI